MTENTEKFTFTGERAFPEMIKLGKFYGIWKGESHTPPQVLLIIWEEHKKRYEVFARPYCIGKTVLDIACGTAYGKGLINPGSYVGLDISRVGLNNARKGLKTNESLIEGNIKYPPFRANSFDTVVCFETLEHIHLNEINRFFNCLTTLLQNDGKFITSPPNRDMTNPGTSINDKPGNKFHCFEMNGDELEQELKKHFQDVKMFGQGFRPNIYNLPPLVSKVKILARIISGDILKIVPKEDIKYGFSPTYWLAVCSEPIKSNQIEPIRFPRVEIPEESINI